MILKFKQICVFVRNNFLEIQFDRLTISRWARISAHCCDDALCVDGVESKHKGFQSSDSLQTAYL